MIFQITLALMVIPFPFGYTNISNNTVDISSNPEISYFNAPLTKKPLSSWIQVQKGVYPNISPLTGKVDIGEPITLLIHFQDPSSKYDISIDDCWAYDNGDYSKAEHKLNLTKDAKGIKEWGRINISKAGRLNTILYGNLTSFKFPDTNKVYLTCNVKICYINCKKPGIT